MQCLLARGGGRRETEMGAGNLNWGVKLSGGGKLNWGG